MSDDLVDELFGDGIRYYPGSRRPIPDAIRDATVKPATDAAAKGLDPSTWGRGVSKRIKGSSLTLYPISSLATALDRAVVTIRMWERNGHIPNAPFALPGLITARGDAAKRRYYSATSITNAVELFDAAGLFGTQRIDWDSNAAKTFTQQLTIRWAEESNQYSS